VIFPVLGFSVREVPAEQDPNSGSHSGAGRDSQSPGVPGVKKETRKRTESRASDRSSALRENDCARALLTKTQDGVLAGVRTAKRNLELNANSPKNPKFALTEILSVCVGLGRALGASSVAGAVLADGETGNIVENTRSLHELSGALYKTCFEAEMAAVHGPNHVDFDVPSKQKLMRSLVDNLESLIVADKTMLDKKNKVARADNSGYRVVIVPEEKGSEEAAPKKVKQCSEATLDEIEDQVRLQLGQAEANVNGVSEDSGPDYTTFTVCAELTRILGAAGLAAKIPTDGDQELAKRVHLIASLSDQDGKIQDACFSNRVNAVHSRPRSKESEKQLKELLDIMETLKKKLPAIYRV